MACFDRLLKSPVNSVMPADRDLCTVSSSASDVLSNTVVTVVCDIAMLQMFMHMYVVANCTTVASL